MNQKFRQAVGVEATDDELKAALSKVTLLDNKIYTVLALYYGFVTEAMTSNQVAVHIRGDKTGNPISSSYVLQLRDKGLQYVRYYLKLNRAKKHPSGIPERVEFWDISVRSRKALEASNAKTIDEVLSLDFFDIKVRRLVSKQSKKEIGDYLSNFNIHHIRL